MYWGGVPPTGLWTFNTGKQTYPESKHNSKILNRQYIKTIGFHGGALCPLTEKFWTCFGWSIFQNLKFAFDQNFIIL